MLIVKLLFISKIPASVATGMETQATNLTSVFLEMAGLRCASYKDNMLQNQALILARVSRNLRPRNLHILVVVRPRPCSIWNRVRYTVVTRNLYVMVSYFKMKPLLEVRYPYELK